MALLMTALMALMPLAGCFGANESNEQEESEGGVFDFAEQLGKRHGTITPVEQTP